MFYYDYFFQSRHPSIPRNDVGRLAASSASFVRKHERKIHAEIFIFLFELEAATHLIQHLVSLEMTLATDAPPLSPLSLPSLYSLTLTP